MLLKSQDRHQKNAIWRSLFSLVRLFAITAKMPAERGNISDHTLKLKIENPESNRIKVITIGIPVTHFHLSFCEKTASMSELKAQAIALVRSPCKRKCSTQENCPRQLERIIVFLYLNWYAATEKNIAKRPIPYTNM